MPQMAPMNWLILYIFFIIIFLMFNIMNYFCFNYIMKPNKKTINKILFNWKW